MLTDPSKAGTVAQTLSNELTVAIQTRFPTSRESAYEDNEVVKQALTFGLLPLRYFPKSRTALVANDRQFKQSEMIGALSPALEQIENQVYAEKAEVERRAASLAGQKTYDAYLKYHQKVCKGAYIQDAVQDYDKALLSFYPAVKKEAEALIAKEKKEAEAK